MVAAPGIRHFPNAPDWAANVPEGLGAHIAHGFPVLDEAFQTSVPGLYVTGFAATQDFGPFFGFVNGSPASATLIVRDLLAPP